MTECTKAERKVDAMAFDIETVPTERALALPYPEDERQPPANYGVDAAAKWREKDRTTWEQDRLKQYSLSPLYGRVVAIGMAHRDDDGNVVESWLTAQAEGDEAQMLATFWTKSATNDRLVSFNGLQFDAPFLLVRSSILGVRCPWGSTLTKRYSTTYHFDVRAVLTQWNPSAKGTLNDWLAAFGLPQKTGSGADVYRMYREGRVQEIGEYAAGDAARTLQMYEQVWPVFD